MELGGRVAVVTGGASGIGRAMCRAFAEREARAVVVSDVNGAGAEEVAKGIEADGGQALSVRTDVARERDIVALVRQAEEQCGPIDLFCSNAGIVVPGGAEARFLILPHPEVATYERRRADDRDRWLRGMRRVQAQITAAT